MAAKRFLAVRRVAAAVATGLLVSVLQPLPARADDDPPAEAPAPAPAPGTEIVEQRTAYAKTFATDVPGQFRSEIHGRPIHYLDSSGAWADIDTSLVRGTDGRYHAKANSVALDVQATSSGALATVSVDPQHSVGFGMLGAAAVPVAVDGTTAAFADLLGGVTLRLDSRYRGVKEDIVLASRLAPSTFVFPLYLTGLTAALDAEGNVIYADASGTERARTPHGRMSDSAVDPRSGDPAMSDGVTYALLPTGPTGLALQVTADPVWLAHPARQYPVTIDPSVYTAGTDDTYVEYPYNNDFSTDTLLKSGTYDGGAHKARSFIHFDGANALDGKVISSATVQVYENWAFSCTPKDVNLMRITQAWSGGGLHTYPGWSVSGVLDTVNVARGYTSCPNAPAYVNFDATTAMTNWASNTWANYGVALVAASETDSYGWKKWDSTQAANDPKLSVTWSEPNRAPGLVSGRTITPKSCATCSPTVTNDATPVLTGTTTDADGDTLRYDFEVYPGHLTTVDGSGHATPGGVPKTTGGSVSNKPSGTQGAWTVSPALADGDYSYRVRAYDGALYGVWSSGWAQFTVDSTAPAAPPVTSSTHPVAGQCYPSNAPAFSWSATSESGIAGYSYVLDQVSSTVPDTTSEGTATSVSYTGKADGTWYFHVRALSNAALWGATTTYAVGLDVTPPATPANVTSTDHTANVPSSDRTVSGSWFAAADAGCGIAGYSWTMNSSASTAADTTVDTTSTSVTSASLADGTWWLHVRAVDLAGLASPDVAYGPLPIDGAGPLAPVVSSLTHAENAWSSVRTATFTWTTPADATAITGFSVSFDANATSDPDAVVDTVLRTWTEANITDGDHWLHVRGLDAAGNWGATAHYRVRVDGTAPGAPALSAAPHANQATWCKSATSTVTAVASDISGIAGYSFSVDRVQAGTPDGVVDATTGTLPLGPLADGVWYVHVAPLNGASLWGPAATYTLRIDGTAPATVASVTSPTHDTVDETNQRVVQVDWSPVTDATSGLVGYTYAFDNDVAWTPDTTVDTTGTTAVSGELTDGTWYFHVAGVDQALNVGTVTTFGPIRIGAAAPPVGATATARFLSLWVPRVDDTDFATVYLSTPVYSSAILAEGFHALNDAQKEYLGDQLYAAFDDRLTEGGWDDPEYLASISDSLYRYVFDKGTLIGLTAAPNQLIATVAQLIDTVVGAVPQEYLDAVDPSIVDHVEELLPEIDLPPAVDDLVEPDIDTIADPVLSDVPSALSDVVQEAMNQIDTLVEDNYPEVVAQVNQVIADAGLQPVADAVYTTAALLPVSPFYAVCWESSAGQNCLQGNAVGTPVGVDTTGDGTLDVTVTFRTGDVDVAAPTELPFVVEVHRRTGSDRDGTTLPAHVWVSYDVPLAGQRILVGVDGLRLAETLPGTADLEYRFRNLDTLTAGRPNGRYSLATSQPGSRTAITFGVHELNQTEPNTVEGAVRLTPAPASLRGTVDVTDTVDPQGTRTNDLHLTATLPLGAPRIAVDGRLVTDRPREDKRVTHHAVIDTLPNGTTDVDVIRTTTSAGRENLTVTHHADGPIDRVSYELVMTDGNAKRVVTGDVRGLPLATTWHANWGGGGGVDGDYSGGPLQRLSVAITHDTGTTRDLTIAARATTLPSLVNFDYGTNADKSVTTVNYAGGGPTGTLAFSYFDRAKTMTLAGSMSAVPPTVTVTFSKTNKSGSIDSDGVIGSLSATLTVDGGRIYRPAPEHVTVQVATANGKTGLGISARVTGLRSMSGDFGDLSTVDGSLAPAGQRLLLVGRVEALYALVDFAAVPATFHATLDRPGLHAHYNASGVASQVSLYIANRPGGPIVDLKLTNAPTEVDVVGTTGADPSITYEANARMSAARVMFSSDATPTDGSGTTVTGVFADLPASVHAELHPNTRSFSATAPGVIGSTLVTFSRNRGKAEVPAGDHATLYISGSKDAGSFRIRNLKSVSGSFDTNGVSNATIDVSTGGQPFAVSAAVNTLRITADIGQLPAHTSFTIDQKTHVRWEASSTVNTLSVYKATTGTGPTLWVSGKTVPRTIDVTGTTSPSYHVVYDAEGTGRAAELKATFAPTYVNGPVPPTTGRYGSVVVHDMPNTVTVDVRNDVSHVDWDADGTAADLSFKVRGLPTTSFIGSGKVVGVPRHWDADRSSELFGVHAYDNELGSVDVGFSNDGEVKSLPGYHARYHAAKFGGKFNVHAKLIHATDVRFDTSNGLIAHAAVDLRGASFRLDVDAYMAAPGSTGATTNEFRVLVDGTLSDLPTDFTVTASNGAISWDANAQLNANLKASIGWTPAVADAGTPANPVGIGVTDGAATQSSTCRPGHGYKLTDADECFAIRAKYNYNGLGKKVTLTLPLSTGGLHIEDMLPPSGAPRFTAHVDMDELATLVADITQEGIPAHADLHFGPISTKAQSGSPVMVHVATAHSANLGSLHGYVRFPGAVLDFAGVRVSGMQVDLLTYSTPKVFDLEVKHGTPLSATVRLSSAVGRIRATMKATTTVGGSSSPSSALLELNNLPATPDGGPLISLTLDQPDEVEKPAGTSNPQQPPAEMHSAACQSSSGGSGESLDGHATDSKHSGLAIPEIHFSAPAAGVGIVASQSGTIARAAGKAEAKDVSIALVGLGKKLDMTLFAKNGRTTISSPQGAVDTFWARVTFGITVPCHTFELSKIEAYPARIYVNGRYDLKIDSATAELTLKNVTDLTLHAGSTYLAYAITGTYGSAELAVSNFSMRSDSFLHVKAAKSFAEWMRDWYNKTVEIKGTYTSLKPSVYRQTSDDRDIGVYIKLKGEPLGCVALVGRPQYLGYSENGVRFTNSQTGVFSILSGQLASNEDERSDLQAFVTAAMAAALSPIDRHFDKDIRFTC